jgi:hypothetical protein
MSAVDRHPRRCTTSPARTLLRLALAFVVLSTSGGCEASENGYDFIREARVVHAVAACGGGRVPPEVDAAAVESHCREVRRHAAAARRDFVDRVRSFVAGLIASNLPRTVVYPFGGGDLLAALATYPDATEITTISLESAGDPRRLLGADARELRDSLKEFRTMLVHLLVMHDSPSPNLRRFERGIIPGQLAFSLAAAAVCGYEPVSLKYFRLEPDGKLHHLTQADVAALGSVRAGRLAGFMPDPDYSPAFRNMELVLRRSGEGSGPVTIVHRHVAANLDNRHFAGSPLRRYLESKGKVAAMTKAGGYLLWTKSFSELRDYLLAHMAFMISDSTGILPRHARAAGFEQTTYGRFNGAFLENGGGDEAVELRQLWRSQPYRELPFRYGYSDVLGANHLMVTRPEEREK